MNNKALHLIKLLQKAPPGLLVEVGGIREPKEIPTEGFSSYYFALECKKSGRPFISCEIESANVKMARVMLAAYGLHPEIVNADGKDFLSQCGPVSFLYLDSSRFPAHTWEQYLAASIVPGGVVSIDDAHEIDGHEYGKAQYVVEHLKKSKIPFNVNITENRYRMIDFILANGKKGST